VAATAQAGAASAVQVRGSLTARRETAKT